MTHTGNISRQQVNLGRRHRIPGKMANKRHDNPLIRLRKERGLTQRNVADTLGVPITTYSTLEQRGVQGQTEWSKLSLAVCELFGAEPETLWPETAERIKATECVAFETMRAKHNVGPGLINRMDDLLLCLPRVIKAMRRLRPKDMEVMILRYGLDNLGPRTYKEICDTILGGVKPACARARERRALYEIRRSLDLPVDHRVKEWPLPVRQAA